MATENNWLKSNIRDRLINKDISLEITLKKIQYDRISFEEASKKVVEKILNKYNNIYIPYSGGMDSEYVFNCFLGHDVKTIIVDTPVNREESKFAFKRCNEVGITPIVIEKTEKELIDIYFNQIYKKIKGPGFNATFALVAGQYAEEKQGNVVIAEHGYNGFNEWDFYNDALIDEKNSIYFFLYDPEIFYSMKQEYIGEDDQIFKKRLYNIPIRPKMRAKYSKEGRYVIDTILNNFEKNLFKDSNYTIKMVD
jgi:hypothetical protein